MRIIETKVYKIDELSDEAKQNACDYVRDNWHDFYPWHNDNQESLKEFAKFLGGKCDWSVSLYGPSSAKITDLPCYMSEEYALSDWIQDNSSVILDDCPFTGFHMDYPLLQPMRDYLNGKVVNKTMEELIEDGCKQWATDYVNDWEYCYTDEYILDFLESNEYEFTEEGELV